MWARIMAKKAGYPIDTTFRAKRTKSLAIIDPQDLPRY
jgi:hypothetical protein